MARKVTAKGRYRKGRAVEQRIVRELRAAYPDLLIARSAGSKSGADVYVMARRRLWFTWPQRETIDTTLCGTFINGEWVTSAIGAEGRSFALQVKATEAEARRAAKKEAERGR